MAISGMSQEVSDKVLQDICTDRELEWRVEGINEATGWLMAEMVERLGERLGLDASEKENLVERLSWSVDYDDSEYPE